MRRAVALNRVDLVIPDHIVAGVRIQAHHTVSLQLVAAARRILNIHVIAKHAGADRPP